jgi:hypothetical protein
MANNRKPSFNDLRAIAIFGLCSGAALILVAMLLSPFRVVAARFASVGALLLCVSTPMFIVVVLLRDTISIAKNRGRFDLRGMLIFMTLVALGLLLAVTLRKM